VAEPQRQTPAALGEFGLIAALTARFAAGGAALLGPGDDAALVSAGDGRIVASTDLLVQDRHFRVAATSPRDLGHKAAAVAMADIAAMGAVPTALLLGLAVPADCDAGWVTQLADGLNAECAVVGARVVGGDVVAADVIVLAMTALGDLQGREPLTRSGARVGDVVAVCGRLGWSAAGLALQERGLVDEFPELTQAHLRPNPPYRQGPEAADLGASALIDVSDGLVADLGHVATASRVRVNLASGALAPDPEPAAAARRLGDDALGWVLTGGEDHALVGTFPAAVRLPASWRVIGTVEAGPPDVTVDGSPWPGAGGWEHFRAPGLTGGHGGGPA